VDWKDAILAAGAVPASHVPEESTGRGDLTEVAGAELVEDTELSIHPVDRAATTPATVSFLDGIQRWKVVYYDGVVPIVRAYVAAGVRRRTGRQLRTAAQASRQIHIAPLAALRPAVREALESSGLEPVDSGEDGAAQPGRALDAARRVVENERVQIEKDLGERHAASLGTGEWLILDGVLSESAILARHPRILGVIKSHGAQYFVGDELTRALTLPDGHRTSVFRPRGRARHEVFSWYLRMWPWEGNDILFGLLRIEARPDAATPAIASAVSGWLARERAPVSTPDPRWDRLLYPVHDVEMYLRARAPRDLVASGASRLPVPSARTGT